MKKFGFLFLFSELALSANAADASALAITTDEKVLLAVQDKNGSRPWQRGYCD
jgi:hypothetical protein